VGTAVGATLGGIAGACYLANAAAKAADVMVDYTIDPVGDAASYLVEGFVSIA
jgi:hypothetical protein